MLLFLSFVVVSILAFPNVESKLAEVDRPEMVPVKVSCLKGTLEDDECVLMRPSVLRCSETYALHRAGSPSLAECVEVTSRGASGLCPEGYDSCHSDLQCCKELPAPIIAGCSDDAEVLDDGSCKEFVPVASTVVCPEDYTPVGTSCQQSEDYDCSPLLPVLTRGPAKPRVKRATDQTFVVTQTCRDIRTLPGELVCRDGSAPDKRNQCVAEEITQPTDRCSSVEGTLESCFFLDVVDKDYSCPTSEEELICVQKKEKPEKGKPRVPILTCRCETRRVESPMPTCVRGELVSLESSHSCRIASTPLRKCPRGYTVSSTDENQCVLKAPKTKHIKLDDAPIDEIVSDGGGEAQSTIVSEEIGAEDFGGYDEGSYSDEELLDSDDDDTTNLRRF